MLVSLILGFSVVDQVVFLVLDLDVIKIRIKIWKMKNVQKSAKKEIIDEVKKNRK